MYGFIFCFCFLLSLTKTRADIPQPTGLQVQTINLTTAVVSWEPIPQQHVPGVLLGYDVRLYIFTNHWRFERTLKSSNTSVVLRGLKDWAKQYDISVRAYTANETGSYTHSYNFKTTTIPGPTNVRISKINVNTLEARWDPIPEQHARGAILGYKIQLRYYYTDDLLQMHKTNITKIIISQVPFRQYLNLVIQGFTSNDTTQATFSGTHYLYPIPYVSGLKVAVNGTTAVATWDPISHKFVFGKLLGYRVRVYHYHYFGEIYNDTKTNKTNIVLRDLQLGYAYLISVAGYTANETGRFYYQTFLTGCGGIIKHQLNGKIELKYFDYYHWHWLNNINCTWYIQGGNSNSLILINVDTLDVRFSNCRESYLRISDGQGQPITTLCRTTTRSLTFAAFGSVKIEFFLGRWWWWWWRSEIALSFFIINSGLNNTFVKDSWSVSVSNTTSTSMEVQWSAYPGQETVKNFIAVCTSQNKHSNIFTATTDRNKSKAVVTNLLKNTEYKVEVVAFLERSSNASYRNVTSLNSTVWKSQSVIARSLEDVPSKPPDNVKAVSSGPTSVMVSWNTLVDSNGVIVGYNVYHQKSHQGENSSVMVRVHSNTTKFKFKNLQQATEYKISVTALTRIGEGPGRSVYVTTGFHQTLTHSSGKFESPNYPKNYPSSADYTWDIAPARVFDKLYILFWEFDLEGRLHKQDFCNTSDFVKVSDNKGNELLLTCGQKSRFAVVATRSAVIKLQSDEGVEKSGFTATYFTLDNINRVMNVNVKSMTDTQVSVQWNRPSAYRRGVFTIFYRKHESNQVWNFTVANNTYATIRGLESSTSYELLVTGSNNVTSYESHSVTFVTQISPTTRPTEEKPTEPMSLMYEYGVNASDQTIPNTWRYTQYCKRVTLNEYGFLFMTERHREVFICRNGILRFESPYYVHWPVYFGNTEQSCQLKILAPYWCLADRSQSTVYYHVYQTSDKSTKSNKVLEQATSDVINLHNGSLPASFKASWVLVVTWENLRHSTQNVETKDLRNTFQAVLITDDFVSFAMYNYPTDGIQWSAPTTRQNWNHFTGARGLPVVGWIAGKCEKFRYYIDERSSTVTIGDIDLSKGHSVFNDRNKGVVKHPHSLKTKWLFQLYMHWRKSNAETTCKKWVKKQPDPRPFLEYLEPCPCTSRQAWFDERFEPEKSSSRWSWLSDPTPCAKSSFISRDKWQQRCCYSHDYSQWGALTVGHPGGGYPNIIYDEKDWVSPNSDKLAYLSCCVDTNLCHLFYQRRPSDDCSRYEPPEWSWMWGDPHFVTLDGKNYTFNGLGEYIMLDARNGFFQLQTRTRLAKGDGTATIFCAAVMREVNSSSVQLNLEKNGNITLLVDGISIDFYKLTNKTKRLNGSVVISRPKEKEFRATYPSGISVTLAESKGALTILAALPKSFKNQTKGLLGTWNGDNLDDFTTPSGRVLPANSTSRSIHFDFGLKWQVSKNNTLFTYDINESVSTFDNRSFVPMFIDELKFDNKTLEDEAREKCGDDVNCLFDAASTNDVSVGLETKVVGTQMVNDSVTLKNSPPKFQNNTDGAIMLKVNNTKYLNISAEDPEGDSIRFDVKGLPQGGLMNTDGLTVFISWKVSMKLIDLQIVATDSKGASSVFKPFFKLCACQNGASCIDASSQNENRFTILPCQCTSGYTGKYCEADIDACKVNLNPCYPGVKCEDFPAPANETGYKCGSCPAGFTGMGDSCQDIDECSGIQHGCQQICYNSPGSYVCGCKQGFKIGYNGRTCEDINECQPTSDCMHLCENTIGSYRCKCNNFFKADPTDSKKCIPESPCKDGNHQCQDICYESNGIATCACSMGYELQSDKMTCKDVDECKTKKNRCNQLCQNTVGSYNCLCVSGFRLSVDNVTCVDINECIDWTFKCPTSQRCHNTMGSYQCKCDEGLYWIDGRCQEPTGQNIPTQPPAPTPPTPTQQDLYNSVNVTVKQLNIAEWDLQMDIAFKKGVSREVTMYCARENTCLTTRRRERRSNNYIVFTSDHVHLLPGYPVQILDNNAVVAFYVKFPSDNRPASSNTVDGQILADVINGSLSRIGQDIGKSLLSVKMYQYRSESTTELPHTTSSSTVQRDSKIIYIIVGCSAAVFVLIIAIIVAWYYKVQSSKKKVYKVTVVEMQHCNDQTIFTNPISAQELK